MKDIEIARQLEAIAEVGIVHFRQRDTLVQAAKLIRAQADRIDELEERIAIMTETDGKWQDPEWPEMDEE